MCIVEEYVLCNIAFIRQQRQTVFRKNFHNQEKKFIAELERKYENKIFMQFIFQWFNSILLLCISFISFHVSFDLLLMIPLSLASSLIILTYVLWWLFFVSSSLPELLIRESGSNSHCVRYIHLRKSPLRKSMNLSSAAMVFF